MKTGARVRITPLGLAVTFEKAERTWARRELLKELRGIAYMGFACNVQEWARVGVKKKIAECKARRREARRLLKIAIAAVEAAR